MTVRLVSHLGLRSAVEGQHGRVATADEVALSRVLTDDEAVALARLGLKTRAHYAGEPQDIEWAIEGDKMYILQARPITSLCLPSADVPTPTKTASPATEGHELVRGLAASTGTVTGAVRVLRSPHDGALLQKGEVLVAPMTNPDWVPTMGRAAAVVTDGGGVTCHAAIITRDLGVPCVVGTRNATTVLPPTTQPPARSSVRRCAGSCTSPDGGSSLAAMKEPVVRRVCCAWGNRTTVGGDSILSVRRERTRDGHPALPHRSQFSTSAMRVH